MGELVPRSLSAALPGGLLILLLAAAPVLADAPPAEVFVSAATDAGLVCEEYSTDSDATQYLCASPVASTERYWYANVDEFDLGTNLAVGRNVFAGGVQPAEADVYALMVEYVTLVLDGESETTALAWLAQMNDGPQVAGSLLVGGWQLDWRIDEWQLDEGDTTGITLDLSELGPGLPDASSPAIAPPPVLVPDPGRPGEAQEEWVYEGTWTRTSYVNDGGFEPTDWQVGESAPGSIRVQCPVSGGDCEVQGLRGEAFVAGGSARRDENGVLTSIRRTEELGNCADGQSWAATLDVVQSGNAATATYAAIFNPRTCEDGSGTLWMSDETWEFAGTLTRHVVPDPSGGSAPSAGPVPRPVPGTGPAAPGSADLVALPFADTVPTVGEISTDPIVLLQSAMLAALLVFLMPFPSQLFNSTLETHEDEVRRWFRLDRLGAVAGGIGAFWASWPGVGVFTLLAALLYGFLDPGFGLDAGSLATFAGMLLGIVLVTAAFAAPAVLAHRRIGSAWTLKVVPLSLLIGVACVLLSRLTGFQPGYLYGLLIGLAFARELSAADEGRATAVGAVAMLGVALVSWLTLGTLPASESFAPVLARTALAALMVAGLEGVVFGLLPMRFLPGEPLYAWNRVVWGVLLAIGGFAFFHILINPASGYLSDTSRMPLLTVIGLLVGFSLVSVAFWAWFRFRGESIEGAASESSG